MLFRPSADQNLIAVHAMLDAWNAEADRFRQAAIAARKGETPTSLTVDAVEETHDGLMSLLDELDDALGKIKAGTPHFADTLHAQRAAMSLLESVGNSWETLERIATEEVHGPNRIAHELRLAAK
jgi:hypothetical protein